MIQWLIQRLSLWRGHHYYVSTACLHGDHDYCNAPTVNRDGSWEVLAPSYSAPRDAPKRPAECKVCRVKCRCSYCWAVGTHS